MKVTATITPPEEIKADTIAIGVFADEELPRIVREREALRSLFDSRAADSGFEQIEVTHTDGKRWVLIGLGERSKLSPERCRIAAAKVIRQVQTLGTCVLCWELPADLSADQSQALVEGSVLASYEFLEYKSAQDGDSENDGQMRNRPPEELVISAYENIHPVVEQASIIVQAANGARDLQNTPANEMTPSHLVAKAKAIARDHPHLSVEALGRSEIEAAGMGAFAGVARGSDQEPQLITLRYDPPQASGPVIGFVGKAVTFDSGGISLKPGLRMSKMKFDMSGGAAVLQATKAIASLGLPIRLITVIGATENLPSGSALKPGDIIRAKNGTTIEVINTDAEGRLVLADCLTHIIEQGAEKIVDIATLTGSVSVTFGPTFAGLISNDDQWCDQVLQASEPTGELTWRLPLHPEYAKQIKGEHADIVNAVEDRKAGTIRAAEFLHHFVGDTPWAHVDIAGIAYDNGHSYAPKGGSGWGVRLLIALARQSIEEEQPN